MSAALVTLGELQRALGGELIGDAGRSVTAIAALERAGPGAITFLAQARLRPLLAASEATCVVLKPEWQADLPAGSAALLTPDPYLYYARLTQWWAARQRAVAPRGVHPGAQVAEGVRLHPSASVGPFAVIEAGAVLEAGVVVGAHGWVGEGAHLGEGTRLAPRVTWGAHCRIGARGLVSSGAVIGGDGFGFAPAGGAWIKIEQLGAVRMGCDVEIGANTCVDRGALDDTVLGDGVKLDNQIQIAHNVQIGAHTAMAGCVGVAGSARIGRHCTFGGAAMVFGHLEIVDHVHVAGASVVMRSITAPGQYSGIFPLDDKASWERNAATLRQLHQLRQRVRGLESDREQQP